MTPPKHILGTFDEALASLRNNVLMMAGLAERTLDRAIKGLLQRNDDLCANAIADDEEIDQLEKQIDKDGVDVLLRYQPVASDLRRVVAELVRARQPKAVLEFRIALLAAFLQYALFRRHQLAQVNFSHVVVRVPI